MDPSQLKKKVLKWEIDLLKPETRSNPELLSSYLAEEFTEISMNGQAYTKSEIIDLVSVNPNTNYTIQKSSVHFLSENAVMHLFDCLVTSSDAHGEILTKRSSIWKQYGSGWRMVFHQGTPVSPN